MSVSTSTTPRSRCRRPTSHARTRTRRCPRRTRTTARHISHRPAMARLRQVRSRLVITTCRPPPHLSLPLSLVSCMRIQPRQAPPAHPTPNTPIPTEAAIGETDTEEHLDHFFSETPAPEEAARFLLIEGTRSRECTTTLCYVLLSLSSVFYTTHPCCD